MRMSEIPQGGSFDAFNFGWGWGEAVKFQDPPPPKKKKKHASHPPKLVEFHLHYCLYDPAVINKEFTWIYLLWLVIIVGSCLSKPQPCIKSTSTVVRFDMNNALHASTIQELYPSSGKNKNPHPLPHQLI